jgi:hypothetical protein
MRRSAPAASAVSRPAAWRQAATPASDGDIDDQLPTWDWSPPIRPDVLVPDDPYGRNTVLNPPTPSGSWAYLVDDFGIGYGPGWWPYYRDGKPDSVRLAPDTAFYAWRDQYVLAGPADSLTNSHVIVTLALPWDDGDGRTMRCKVYLDLRDRSVTVPDSIPVSARTEAQEKGQRVLDLVLAARAERRRGASAPVTAHQRWRAEGGQP